MKRPTRCCCFSVRTGTMIMATLGIVWGAINAMSLAGSLSGSGLAYSLIESNEEYNRQLYVDGNMSRSSYQNAVAVLETIKGALPVALGVGLAVCVFAVAINAMLVCGIRYTHPCLMLPWLIFKMFGLAVSTLAAFGLGVVLMASGSTTVGLAVWAVAFPVLALGYYLWAVVQAAFMEVKEEGGNGYSRFGMVSTAHAAAAKA